ncbi:MAG: hypothetical protein ACQEQ0_10235 [Bacteroidota bacterium]
MKTYHDFTAALSKHFQLPVEIFQFDIAQQEQPAPDDDFFVTEAEALEDNAYVDYFQYLGRFDEGWQGTRLYISPARIKPVLQFIKKYHEGQMSEDELQALRNVLNHENGEFAILDEEEDFTYLSGTFDKEQSFIEVVRPLEM